MSEYDKQINYRIATEVENAMRAYFPFARLQGPTSMVKLQDLLTALADGIEVGVNKALQEWKKEMGEVKQ